MPKNKKEIKYLLDLKFNNNYDILDNEYRIHDFVNYILLDSLTEQFKDNYFNNELKRPELLGRIGYSNIVPFNFIKDDEFRMKIAQSKLKPIKK